MQIKARWNKRAKEQSLEDIAGAVNMICWKIATNSVLELENQGCQTHSNHHRLQIIGELLAFLVSVADRLVYESLTDEERQDFILFLAWRMTDTYMDNLREVLGPGDYRRAFIDMINQRGVDYSELSFNEGEAGFDFLRYFGEQMEALMVEKHWVSQQAIEVTGPEAVKTLKTAMHDLFD
jgi:hypothetical protein